MQDKFGNLPVTMNPENSPGQCHFAGVCLTTLEKNDMASGGDEITDGELSVYVKAYDEEDPYLPPVIRGLEQSIQRVEFDLLRYSEEGYGKSLRERKQRLERMLVELMRRYPEGK